MRRLADAERIERFMKELDRSARGQMTVYLTGGSSAVLRGWRANTVYPAIDAASFRQAVESFVEASGQS